MVLALLIVAGIFISASSAAARALGEIKNPCPVLGRGSRALVEGEENARARYTIAVYDIRRTLRLCDLRGRLGVWALQLRRSNDTPSRLFARRDSRAAALAPRRWLCLVLPSRQLALARL